MTKIEDAKKVTEAERAAAEAAIDAVQNGEWGRVLTCYAAWNIQRSTDGGKPTFEHRRFCCVGALSDAALRWV
jgi:predicted dehydrogenase